MKEFDNTLTNIESFSDTYSNLQNTVRSNSMQSMFANMDTSSFASNTLFMDYGRDVTDFNKTSITSQLGYLAAAQANILQEQSSRLLV
jgi:flagellin